MKTFILPVITCVFFSITAFAQTDSLLLTLLDTTPKEPLLPAKMIFTQRFLWGEKGFMRKIKVMPLNEANRKTELKIRRGMLVAHQVDGYVTLACMVAQGIIGAKLYSYKITGDPKHDPGYQNLRRLHANTAIGVDVAYFSTAALSLFAPPPLLNRKSKKINSIRLHKNLAILHFSSMLATNILSLYAKRDPTIRAYHRAAAYTAFASFGLAVIVMKF
ncbi:MAG TPA: hypothetical protein VII99_04385 [Bacteroidia bacterium]